jgi:uncharacterized membrane protein
MRSSVPMPAHATHIASAAAMCSPIRRGIPGPCNGSRRAHRNTNGVSTAYSSQSAELKITQRQAVGSPCSRLCMKLFTPESSAGTSHAATMMRNPGRDRPRFGIWRAYHRDIEVAVRRRIHTACCANLRRAKSAGILDPMHSGTGKSLARIQSIDVIRGLVMVLMAIDHVRVYSGLPAGGPSPGIFFTRWVTHFCAPAFAFLAGTSAYLYGRKLLRTAPLARFLITRGLLLVVLELTLIRFFWTFNFNYRDFVLAGVIWMLGWCMVLLAPLVALPARLVGAIGLAIIFFQQVFRTAGQFLPHALRAVWEFVYPTGIKNESGIAILYVLVPWFGVMAAGYGFGLILTREPRSRDRICLALGLAATAIFLIAGALPLLLHPPPPHAPPFLFGLLSQQKYPASPLFLLMTLGPAIALLPVAQKAHGRAAGILATFGRVPMFYYLLHILAIHVAALLVTVFREGRIHPEWYATAPYTFLPPDHRWTLPLLYLVWAIVVAYLYFACRWYAALKSRHPASVLKYL